MREAPMDSGEKNSSEIHAPDALSQPDMSVPIMNNMPAPEPMTRREYRQFMFTATLTAVGVGLVISAGMVLVVLFCVFVWLK